ncbi:glycosyltransferase family 25 protein [[Mannheimia] succiniciproducens]|nr:glycosyltransferase family 25 protein [[Mannheimia] succiniciproducens]
MKIELPKIFIISLKNSPRRDVIAQRFNALGIKFEFFDAIYGKDLSQEELSKIDREFAVKRFSTKKPLTLGEIGCALSHIAVYEHILKNNIEQAIIFEDDAIIHHEFKKIVEETLSKVPSRREIIFFEHGKAKSWFCKRSIHEGYKLVRYRSPSKNSKRCIFRTTSYLITLSGAKKLLNHAYPVRMPSDYLTGGLQITQINAYGIEPPCVFCGVDSEINAIEDRYN